MPEMIPEILWEEGMLLRPQHMQAFQRHCVGLVHHQIRTQPFFFGVQSLSILKEAIANWTFEMTSCELVMPDGSIVVKDKTAVIDPVEFRHLKTDAPRLEVWLAVPFHSDSGKNVQWSGDEGASPGGSAGVRYFADVITRMDENIGGNPREIEVKRFNARIFVGSRPPQGQATLKIAELKKVVSGDEGGSRYELSADYVPACLSMEASPTLNGIVKDLLHRLEEKNHELLSNLRHRRDLLVGESPETEVLIKLQATNGVLPVLRQLAGQAAMHPYQVYLQLTRLIGDLAIFSENWEPPVLILYDHENPLNAFQDLKGRWLALLEKAIETGVSKMPFQKSSLLDDAVEVELPPAYFAHDAELYLSVITKEDQAEVERSLAMARLTAPDELEDCRRKRTAGIPCRREPNLHPALRQRDGQVFMRIETTGEMWEAVGRAKRLALDTRTVGGLGEQFELYATNVRGDG